MLFGKLANTLEVAAEKTGEQIIHSYLSLKARFVLVQQGSIDSAESGNERGDVPGWVLVVLMTTGLVTAIWTIAAPRLTAILRNSLDSMNGIR
jgi:hypothetical protein